MVMVLLFFIGLGLMEEIVGNSILILMFIEICRLEVGINFMGLFCVVVGIIIFMLFVFWLINFKIGFVLIKIICCMRFKFELLMVRIVFVFIGFGVKFVLFGVVIFSGVLVFIRMGIGELD